MSAPTLDRPRTPESPDTDGTEGQRAAQQRSRRASDDILTLGLAVLLLAALIPFSRVFIGPEWIRPVVGSALLSVGIGWGARRIGAGPLTHLLISVLGLLVFITIAFLPQTAAFGLLPTTSTLVELRDLFLRGLDLVVLRPSPTFAEAGLLLLAVGGVWIVAYLADGLLFILRSALKAIAAALVLWSVPLAMAPSGLSITIAAGAMLLAAGVLMLLGNTMTSASYGVGVVAAGHTRAPLIPVSGWVTLAAVTVVAVGLAGLLPGFQARPVVDVRTGNGTTITTNPIVGIQRRLVAQNTGPVLRVDSTRPLYLRTTALDAFNDREEWGIDGTIAGDRIDGRVRQPEVAGEELSVQVLIEGIETGAILAPTPQRVLSVSGPRAPDMRFDERSSTLALPGDLPLRRGDAYTVDIAVPEPDPALLRAIPIPGGGPSTQLPDVVPPAVAALAREIVTTAGATTMFDQALAIQDRLRGWTYSTQPQFGQGATRLEQFINGQQGYCEQFAGTMAVMLRTLGIPSRLAVGYTPGTQGADGLWTVTNANAHAWVEVDFGPLGWVTFEPTPRTDGNVLVPTGNTIVPPQTVAEQDLSTGPFEPVGPGEIPQARPSVEDRAPVPAPLDPQVGAPSAPGRDGSGPPAWLMVAGLLAVAGLARSGAQRRRRQALSIAPAERIARARQRIERAGSAVGSPRRPDETDLEYFRRLADGHVIGETLARPSTRAVYAPEVTDIDARAAESAASSLRSRLRDRAGRMARLRMSAHDRLSRLTR